MPLHYIFCPWSENSRHSCQLSCSSFQGRLSTLPCPPPGIALLIHYYPQMFFKKILLQDGLVEALIGLLSNSMVPIQVREQVNAQEQTISVFIVACYPQLDFHSRSSCALGSSHQRIMNAGTSSLQVLPFLSWRSILIAAPTFPLSRC